MKYSIGDELYIKDNLSKTKSTFGVDRIMREMTGKKYIVTNAIKNPDGCKLNGYWFSTNDLTLDIISPKKPQIFHFDNNELDIAT